MPTDEDLASSTTNVAVMPDASQPDITSDNVEPKTAQKRKASSPSSSAQSREQEEAADTPPKRIKLDDRDGATKTDKPSIVEEEDKSRIPSESQNDWTPSSRNGATPEKASSTRPEPQARTSGSPTNARRASPPPAADRRKNFSQEERRRGQRLFGGLLSTLSQTTTNSQQKRRQEIERRQQERAQQQRAADDKHRAERMAKLDRVRRVEQVKLDEQAMQTRHSTLLATAHSLQTQCNPKIYYRPWELSESQEKVIKEQVRRAEETIEKETQEYKSRKEQRLRDLGATLGEPAPRKTANHRAPAPPSKPVAHDREHEENGDVLVDAGEDTVIY